MKLRFHKEYPRFKVNLIFMFRIYSQHRIDNFLVNKVGYDCCNGRQFTSTKAHFTCRPFDTCASVNVPKFMKSLAQCVNFVDFS